MNCSYADTNTAERTSKELALVESLGDFAIEIFGSVDAAIKAIPKILLTHKSCSSTDKAFD